MCFASHSRILLVLFSITALLVNGGVNDEGGRRRKQHQQKVDGALSTETITLSSGLQLSFSDPRAAGLLTKWARELDTNGGSVSHATAVSREREVVSLVESGQWSPQAYNEYQRLASATGNVDSAMLLMEYGVGQGIAESIRRGQHKLHEAAARCDLISFVALLQLQNNNEEDKDDDGGPLYSINSLAHDGASPLITSSYVGCVPIVELILHKARDEETAVSSFDVDHLAMSGVSALMVAAAQGHEHVIALLVKEGRANVNLRHAFADTTPLHMAAEMDRAVAIKTLCGLGADAHAYTSTGGGPLHLLAQRGGSRESIKALVRDCHCNIEALLNEDTTALYIASQEGHAHTVAALIDEGANVHFAMPHTRYKGTFSIAKKNGAEGEAGGGMINTEAGNGAEALHVAAENGHHNVVEMLLERGKANVNSLSIGVSALHLACQYNRIEVARSLLRVGASNESAHKIDVNIHAYTDGATPLYHCVGRGRSEISKLLLVEGNASPDAVQTRGGGTPLLYAVIMLAKSGGGGDNSLFACIKLLLRHGANIHAQGSKDGLSPLHVALSLGEEKGVNLVQTLLRYDKKQNENAALSARGDVWGGRQKDNGFTVFHFAIGNEGVLQALVTHLKSINIASHQLALLVETKSTSGFTPLLHSCDAGDEHAASLLFSLGAEEKSYNDHGGLTCLFLASMHGHLRVLRLLFTIKAAESKLVLDNESKTGPTAPMLTPLLVALQNDKLSAVDFLLQQGADPNKGGGGAGALQAPLLLAVMKNSARAVELLLNAEASCAILVARSANGDTQSLIALARGARKYDVLQALTKFKSCVEVE